MSELYQPSDRRLSAKLVPTFADRGVSHSQHSGPPYNRNLGFLDQSRYFLFQIAPQLHSRSSQKQKFIQTVKKYLQSSSIKETEAEN
jgi:hypothetical protein